MIQGIVGYRVLQGKGYGKVQLVLQGTGYCMIQGTAGYRVLQGTGYYRVPRVIQGTGYYTIG